MYKNLTECLLELERHGRLVRITEPIDPDLEMAAIHRRVYALGGPALWFTNVKGSKFSAVSNLFGTIDRSHFLFRDTLKAVKKMIALKTEPHKTLRRPWQLTNLPFAAINALPKRVSDAPVLRHSTTLSQLPQIKCWQDDGGAFITLPLVYTEDPDRPGIAHANLGMYRIQISGNDYTPDHEAGLHYQLHRGIGVHQARANAKGVPLKVSIFVGGLPAHILSAVMPLPEGMSEMLFAGALAGRRFRYGYRNGYAFSADADFVIAGDVYAHDNKQEGPFGDHLGYYSLRHDFPVLHVRHVWHRPQAVWAFTVVGRPPQEDTNFGALIHELTDHAVPSEIPGLQGVHAVDAAGVHPLLLAIGSERYTPYYKERFPKEILTIANHVLGTGQLSLAKYLLIVAREDNPNLNIHNVQGFFEHLLERINWSRDLHFQTQTSIDTLDYSGTSLNSGSKVVMAAAGEPLRQLWDTPPPDFYLPEGFTTYKMAFRGCMVITCPVYTNSSLASLPITRLDRHLQNYGLERLQGIPLIILADDAEFVAANLNNFVWVTFTRSNPSHDIHGVLPFTEHKHWGCKGPLMIDARIKPHHAPPLLENPEIEKRVDALAERGKSLYGII